MAATETKLNAEKVLALLKNEGLLSLNLKGFESREAQQKMLQNVLEAYNEDSIALIEAGTGTGKSFAYLIPALLFALQHQEKTVISTHTIALQEQLLLKDIPLLSKALNLDLKAVLIKGMGNYVCLRKLKEVSEEKLFLEEPEKTEIEKIEIWNENTRDGSRSTLPFAPSPATWERVSADSDSCTNIKCSDFQECHFFKARRRANDAQILIANHHLLFADLSRRAENENYEDPAILPPYKRVIIDEAHHIEDIATEYFAKNVNRLNLLRIIGRLAAEKKNSSQGKIPLLKDRLVDYYKNKTPPDAVTNLLTRLTIDLNGTKNDLLTEVVKTFEAFQEFMEKILPKDNKKENSSEKENKLRLHPYHQTHPFWHQELLPLAKQLINAIDKYVGAIEGVDQEIKKLDEEKLNEQTKGIRFEILSLSNRLRQSSALLNEFISATFKADKVRWIEQQSPQFNANVHLNDANLDISQACVDFLFSKFSTVILTSATLTSNRQFQFIRERLGLKQSLLPKKTITENAYGSPFNFEKQSLLLVPTDIKNPSENDFIEDAAEKIWQIVKASHGNGFILFTSYSMLNRCYKLLEKRLIENKFLLFKQGDESRQKLLEKFKKKDRSLLFGTDSFWEGVDVAGEALRLVVIVKLPFRVPSDPLIEARAEALQEKGQDPFSDYSLPTAIVKFKQGFGRLIRNKKDRGCIVCLDSRILTKGYGKQFLNSLPNCQKFFGPIQELEKEMIAFYKKTYHLTRNS